MCKAYGRGNIIDRRFDPHQYGGFWIVQGEIYTYPDRMHIIYHLCEVDDDGGYSIKSSGDSCYCGCCGKEFDMPWENLQMMAKMEAWNK